MGCSLLMDFMKIEAPPKCKEWPQMQPRNPTKIAVGNHGPMDWNNCSSVYNDQPDCKGGGCFLERLCFLLFIVQKSGFYLLRYEWNPSSAPHPPNFQRVVKLFILAGFRHTRYCWKNSDHHQLIWWKYTHYLQVVTATMSSFSKRGGKIGCFLGFHRSLSLPWGIHMNGLYLPTWMPSTQNINHPCSRWI